jgi:hypothetical protein
MPKPKNGTLGRKIKMSQPVAIDFTTFITLVEGKVIKGPTAPKMEVMEKWIVSGGRDISVSRDHESGRYLAILTAKGADGPIEYEGEGETMALAVTEAIVEFLKAQPKPDPEGKDLPLFRGNGGVASVAEMDLDEEPAGSFIDVGAIARAAAAELNAAVATMPEELPPVREWTWLNMINPGDAKRWKKEAPTFEGSPVLEFEEGDDSNERGWYLDPDFFYDREMGIITQRNPVPGQVATVWSRDVETQAGAVAENRRELVAPATA